MGSPAFPRLAQQEPCRLSIFACLTPLRTVHEALCAANPAQTAPGESRPGPGRNTQHPRGDPVPTHTTEVPRVAPALPEPVCSTKIHLFHKNMFQLDLSVFHIKLCSIFFGRTVVVYCVSCVALL